MQKKYYAKLYCRQKIAKQPFTHHSAYLQEEIRKMHQYQEEYLLLVKYDVKEILDVYETIEVIEQKEEDISTRQKALYAERDSLKRSCKMESDFARFRSSSEAYYQQLDDLKTDKKKCRLEKKILNRILDREYSAREDRIEQELEREIPIRNMDDPNIDKITDVDIPENPYRSEKAVEVSELDKNTDVEEVEDVPVTMSIAGSQVKESLARENDSLPVTMAEYCNLSLTEKLELFHFESMSDDEMYHMVHKFLDKIQFSNNLSEMYEECMVVISAYQKKQKQVFIDTEVQQAIEIMDTMDMTKQQFDKADASMKAMIFDFESLEYQQGLQVYKAFLDKFEIHREPMEVYEEYDAVYETSIRGKQGDKIEKKDWTRGGR